MGGFPKRRSLCAFLYVSFPSANPVDVSLNKVLYWIWYSLAKKGHQNLEGKMSLPTLGSKGAWQVDCFIPQSWKTTQLKGKWAFFWGDPSGFPFSKLAKRSTWPPGSFPPGSIPVFFLKSYPLHFGHCRKSLGASGVGQGLFPKERCPLGKFALGPIKMSVYPLWGA